MGTPAAESEEVPVTRALKRTAVAVFVVGAMFGAGLVVAEWLATGSGSGSAKALSAQELTTVAVVSPSATLFPGGSGDLSLTINNPNSYPVTVTGVSGDGAITSDTSGCTTATHGVTFTNQTGLTLAVPAQDDATFVLENTVAMAASSADACQGATFTIPVALTGHSGVGVDADGDGYYSLASGGNDCNDNPNNNGAAFNPGEPEVVADGVDQDCDAVDSFYQDLDHDGWGTAVVVDGTSLMFHVGEALETGDCNDSVAAIHPGVPDDSWDTIDNDCDGLVDEEAP